MMPSASKPNVEPQNRPRFFHGTLVRLDGQPLFARGSLPTIHTSLTYTVWYIYWVSQIDRANRNPSFYVYELVEAERYLVPRGEGLYSVSDIGAIPYDDRSESLLAGAPELFKKGWEWSGKLTYLPARCVKRVTAQTIRQEVDPQEWIRLCRDMDEKHPFRGVIVPANLTSPLTPTGIFDFLRNR